LGLVAHLIWLGTHFAPLILPLIQLYRPLLSLEVLNLKIVSEPNQMGDKAQWEWVLTLENIFKMLPQIKPRNLTFQVMLLTI
jgi:hypothetical protein